MPQVHNVLLLDDLTTFNPQEWEEFNSISVSDEGNKCDNKQVPPSSNDEDAKDKPEVIQTPFPFTPPTTVTTHSELAPVTTTTQAELAPPMTVTTTPHERPRFYVVFNGQKIGIYQDWALAHAQVDGFPGNWYKGFHSIESVTDAFLIAHQNGVLGTHGHPLPPIHRGLTPWFPPPGPPSPNYPSSQPNTTKTEFKTAAIPSIESKSTAIDLTDKANPILPDAPDPPPLPPCYYMWRAKYSCSSSSKKGWYLTSHDAEDGTCIQEDHQFNMQGLWENMDKDAADLHKQKAEAIDANCQEKFHQLDTMDDSHENSPGLTRAQEMDIGDIMQGNEQLELSHAGGELLQILLDDLNSPTQSASIDPCTCYDHVENWNKDDHRIYGVAPVDCKGQAEWLGSGPQPLIQ
ncbi:hypothetical protein P691DRAFT_766211 [Macrolepiota fuliginosa MF-IS2]|uniref:Ribonuclease H1 N-terminal domain-containing protein n=1 Tax=Macrolepiota fuliginosa MF-IS2 TaxID=1400762 RepID=A0A9P6BX97_9AGAR|nr:hypothetical protein P691DRAFT_766211 [Macrolepiota fuliginosa MF-IS2]